MDKEQPKKIIDPYYLMCTDSERAKQNRAMVEAKQYVEWWERMEAAVRSTAEGELLPSWVVIGQPPRVGRRKFLGIGIEEDEPALLLAEPSELDKTRTEVV